MDQDETWCAGRPHPWPHCVRWGPSFPSPKWAQPPQFSAHICCHKMAGWIKMPLGMEIGLGPSHIVLDGDPAPLPKRGHSPQFLAHVCCGQTAVWIKMPLGTKVGLGLGHIVLHGDPAPPPEMGTAPPIFGPCLLWPNGRPPQLLMSTCYYLFILSTPAISREICSIHMVLRWFIRLFFDD